MLSTGSGKNLRGYKALTRLYITHVVPADLSTTTLAYFKRFLTGAHIAVVRVLWVIGKFAYVCHHPRYAVQSWCPKQITQA